MHWCGYMLKITPWILVVLSLSCDESPQIHQAEPILLQAEKCSSDGATIYVRCEDGKQKVFELGFGNFSLVENGKLTENFRFCPEDPAEFSINFKNSYICYVRGNAKGVPVMKVLYNEPTDSVCREMRKFDKTDNVGNLKVEARKEAFNFSFD